MWLEASVSLIKSIFVYTGVRAFERYIPLKESKKKYIFFFLLFFIAKNRHGIGKKWLLSIRNRAEIRPLEKGRKDSDRSANDSRNFWAQWKMTISVNKDYHVNVNALRINYLPSVYAIYRGTLIIIINDIDNLTSAIIQFIPTCLQTN